MSSGLIKTRPLDYYVKHQLENKHIVKKVVKKALCQKKKIDLFILNDLQGEVELHRGTTNAKALLKSDRKAINLSMLDNFSKDVDLLKSSGRDESLNNSQRHLCIYSNNHNGLQQQYPSNLSIQETFMISRTHRSNNNNNKTKQNNSTKKDTLSVNSLAQKKRKARRNSIIIHQKDESDFDCAGTVSNSKFTNYKGKKF